jgi:hypothetical protein
VLPHSKVLVRDGGAIPIPSAHTDQPDDKSVLVLNSDHDPEPKPVADDHLAHDNTRAATVNDAPHLNVIYISSDDDEDGVHSELGLAVC